MVFVPTSGIGRCNAEPSDSRSSRTKRDATAVFGVTSPMVEHRLASELRCCISKDEPTIGPDAFWTAARSSQEIFAPFSRNTTSRSGATCVSSSVVLTLPDDELSPTENFAAPSRRTRGLPRPESRHAQTDVTLSTDP